MKKVIKKQAVENLEGDGFKVSFELIDSLVALGRSHTDAAG
jgi:hypothetical protein